MNKQQIKSWAEKFFVDNHKDFSAFDFDAEYDDGITPDENKGLLREKIKVLLTELPKKNEIMPKQQYETLVLQEIEKAETQARLEFENTLKQIEKNKTTDILEEIYLIPKQYAKMVARGYSKGFILYGCGGLGKSYLIMRAFREENKPFVYQTGHTTPLELYNFLFNHRKDNIILDDVNLLNNEVCLNLLKSCLNDNSRLVCYNTTSNKLRVPSSFVFEGSIILLLNDKPSKNESLKAVESRVLNHELKMDYKTIIKVLYEIAKMDYKELTQEERSKIACWIKDNTSEATKNLNLRLLFSCYEFYRFDKKSWKNLAKNLIDTDENKELIIQGYSQYKFCEETGLSRATYFRYKKELINQ